MKTVLLAAQHGGEDMEDANRRLETKVLPKVQIGESVSTISPSMPATVSKPILRLFSV